MMKVMGYVGECGGGVRCTCIGGKYKKRRATGEAFETVVLGLEQVLVDVGRDVGEHETGVLHIGDESLELFGRDARLEIEELRAQLGYKHEKGIRVIVTLWQFDGLQGLAVLLAERNDIVHRHRVREYGLAIRTLTHELVSVPAYKQKHR